MARVLCATAAASLFALGSAQSCSYQGSFDLRRLRPNAAAPGSKERAILIGSSNIRCTEAARSRFSDLETCYTFIDTRTDPALFNYMRCIHPESNMHSWVYLNGVYVGDGFRMLSNPSDSRCARPAFQNSGDSSVPIPGSTVKCFGRSELPSRLTKAAVNTNCPKDCSSIQDDQFPARFPAPFEATIKHAPLVLFGWSGCPCTSYAREHFQANEYCYQEDVWPTSDDKLFAYLQCRYGSQHHSFIFLGGHFMGNGFSFNVHDRYAEFGSEAVFKPLALQNHVKKTCPFLGLQNLIGGKLKSCTQANDRMNTGWTRSGSCNWDPNDGGYHEVCVEMTQEFLDKSVKYDANDLSRVVSRGGHWCICAWAFASAVARSTPADLAAGKPEGIKLMCESTNGKLRDVYSHYATLQSPSRQTYLSKPALALANRLCPDKTNVKVQGTTVSVTKDESKNLDPCYVLKGSSVSFPAFEDKCPSLSPMPSSCGKTSADLTSLKCARPYSAWFSRCSGDQFITQLDKALSGGFTKFNKMCVALEH